MSGGGESRSFAIRHATVADAEAIAAVNVDAGRAGWATFLGAERLAALEPPVGRWRELIGERTGAGTVLVATLEARTVGFASVCLAPSATDSHTGELTTLYAHPDVWSAGIGRALMRRALDELAAAGCHDAVLWTEERNERPRRIYERAGWRLDGERRERDYLGATIREVRYRFALAPDRRGP